MYVCFTRLKNGMDRQRNGCVRWRLSCRRKMPRYSGSVCASVVMATHVFVWQAVMFCWDSFFFSDTLLGGY